MDGLGAVSAIGAGINMTHDNLRRGIRALRAAGLEPRDIATSSFRITWFVERSAVDQATRLLHETLVTASLPVP